MIDQVCLMECLVSVVLFFIVANPMTFKLVDGVLGSVVRIARGGVPTTAGLVVHALVFVTLEKALRDLI
jgi:hypothetical protein